MLAGGIGIMNIMLVNVAERRREVGIRKAVGATRMAIINQFVESAIIGLIGGVIGYLIGMIMAYTTSIFILPLEPMLIGGLHLRSYRLIYSYRNYIRNLPSNIRPLGKTR